MAIGSLETLKDVGTLNFATAFQAAGAVTAGNALSGPETHLVVYTGYIDPPGWSRFTTVFLDLVTVTGTTKTVDLAFSLVDPLDKTKTIALAGSGITQLTAAGFVVVGFNPYLADDDVATIYNLAVPAGIPLYYTLTLGTKSENEIQTLTLTGGAQNDTFGLTAGGNEGTLLVTCPAGGFTNVDAAQIKATLITISGWEDNSDDITVTNEAGDTWKIVFTGLLSNADIGAITVTNGTGAAAGSVAETNKGVVGDETYDINFSAAFSA
jgi:hypothetical protein